MPVSAYRLSSKVLFILLCLFLMGYVARQIYLAAAPPRLEIISPKPWEYISAPALTISGNAFGSSVVKVNGSPVASLEDGRFTATAVVAAGSIATFEIEAMNRRGRIARKQISVVREKMRDEEVIYFDN